MRRRTWIINGALAIAVLVVAALAIGSVGSSVGEDEEIRTVAVKRGTVIATVSASGELVAPTDVTIDFAVGGRLIDVLVESGDRVAHGDLLARLDDADALDQLTAAEAGLEAAEAALDRVINRLTPAQRSLGSAQIAAASEQVKAAEAALARAEEVAAANAALYDQQVVAAREQFDTLKANQTGQVAAARANLAAAEASLRLLREGQSKAQLEVGDAQIEVAEAAVDAARVSLNTTEDVAEANADAYDVQVQSAESALFAAQERLAELEDRLAGLIEEAEDCDPSATPEICADLDAAAAQQAELVAQMETTVLQAENALATAEAGRAQGLARDEQAVALARSQLDQARRALDLTEAQVEAGREDPSDAALAQARAQVQLAQAQLDQALRPIDDSSVSLAEANRQTGLARDGQATEAARSQLSQSRSSLDLARAQVDVNQEPPSEAEIAAATAQVEQARATLNRATRLVEETVLRAPVGGTVADVYAEVGEYVAGGATPGSLGFIRLTDVNELMIEAQFSEADAVRMQVGRSAAVEINALPEQRMVGTVIRIDPTGTAINDLVTYGVRVALLIPVEGARPGQTVTVDVIVDEVEDTLFVPSSALEVVGDETYVTVFDGVGAPSRRPVRAGLQGDGTTQIVAGLREGEQVAMIGGGYVPPTQLVGG